VSEWVRGSCIFEVERGSFCNGQLAADSNGPLCPEHHPATATGGPVQAARVEPGRPMEPGEVAWLKSAHEHAVGQIHALHAKRLAEAGDAVRQVALQLRTASGWTFSRSLDRLEGVARALGSEAPLDRVIRSYELEPDLAEDLRDIFFLALRAERDRLKIFEAEDEIDLDL